eukprot:GHUV01024847.1.p2 GENE.GHUV01024847.1~~GHUV01024847.1.p2  ORF type:complete len:102 (-),score=18.28 GHUV01024847.1:1203-1508(-)
MLQVVVPVLNHVMELVETDHERLHDYGNDRTYSSFQCLVNINMVRIMRYGHDRQRLFTQVTSRFCTSCCIVARTSSAQWVPADMRHLVCVLPSQLQLLCNW